MDVGSGTSFVLLIVPVAQARRQGQSRSRWLWRPWMESWSCEKSETANRNRKTELLRRSLARLWHFVSIPSS